MGASIVRECIANVMLCHPSTNWSVQEFAGECLPGMKESDFLNTIKKKFYKKYPSGLWIKLPDYFGQDGTKKPFDVVCINKSGFTAIEAKIHNKLSDFYFDKIRPHQILCLRKIRQNEGKAFVLIGVRAKTTQRDRRLIQTELANIRMNIYIPVQWIPGKNEVIIPRTLNIRRIAKYYRLHGTKAVDVNFTKIELERFFGI